MTAITGSFASARPQAVATARRSAPALPVLPQRRGAVVVYARNFKTRETEDAISRNTPDADELNAKLQEYVDKLKSKWNSTDEKPAVVAVGISAFIGLWALSGLVDRLDKLPLVGGFLELVGLLVTGWFTYRYLTFAPDREELKKNAGDFYQKVTGKKTW